MAGAVGFNEDCLSGDDCVAILTIISEDCFEEVEELSAQVSDIVKEVELPKAAARFPCDNCDKICKIKRGLRMHSNVKHGLQLFFSSFLCTFVQGRWHSTQNQLIQIYSVDWTDVYDTHNIVHSSEPVSH